MNIKELTVSIGVDVRGIEKLQALNKEIRRFIRAMKEARKTYSESMSKAVANVGNTVKDVQKDVIDATPSATPLLKAPEVEGEVLTEKKKKDLLEVATFLKSLKNAPIVASLLYIGKTAIDVARKFGSLILSLTKTSYELLKLSRNFGVSTDSLQKFGYAAVAQGVKLDDFNSAVANLRRQSADIILGRGDISPYALLGINPHQDPEKILVQLHKRLRELPESLGTAFASDLGLSMDMINFVRSGDFARMQSRPILSRSELKELEDLRKKALDFLNLLSVMAQRVLAAFSPIISKILETTNFYLKSFIKDVKAFRDDLWNLALTISGMVMLVNPALGGILSILTGIGMVVEDLVKHGGEGLLTFILYFAYTIKDVFKNIWSDFINIGNFTSIKGLAEKYKGVTKDYFLPGNARVMLEQQNKNKNVTVNGSIKVIDSENKTVGKGKVSGSLDDGINVLNTSLSGSKP